MNIFIITVGSRGDVQPYVALGKGLLAAGDDVTVCTAVHGHPAANVYAHDRVSDTRHTPSEAAAFTPSARDRNRSRRRS